METLLLTHGALGSGADLQKLKESLVKENFNVLSFSFSGHGHTAFEDKFGIEQFAGELEEFILKNKLVKPSVIGYSMGGYVALYLALKKPAIINKIITLGTKFNWSSEVVEKETRMLVPEIMLEKIPAYAKSLEAKHGSSWKELLAKTAVMMRDISEQNYLNTETLKTIHTPVFIGLGDKDQMVTIDETLNVYRTLPNANMYMLPGTKHQLESLNHGFFTELVKTCFL